MVSIKRQSSKHCDENQQNCMETVSVQASYSGSAAHAVGKCVSSIFRECQNLQKCQLCNRLLGNKHNELYL